MKKRAMIEEWGIITEEQLVRCEMLLNCEDEGMRILGITGLHNAIKAVVPLGHMGFWDKPGKYFNEVDWTPISKARITVIRKRQLYDKRKEEGRVS